MANQYTINFHNKYKKYLEDENFQKDIYQETKLSKEKLCSLISTDENYTKINCIINCLIELIEKEKIFLRIHDNMIEQEFLIINKDFKAIVSFLIVGYGTESVSRTLLKNYSFILEIDQLHSYKKGHGKQLVELLKRIANISQVPLALYDGTENLEGYYEKLGFTSTKRLSGCNEVYKVYYPINRLWINKIKKF